MGANRRNGGLHNDFRRQETKQTTPSQTKGKKTASAKSYRANGFRFEDLFNTMNLGVIYHDHKGRVIDANPAAEMILGITKDRFIGRSAKDKKPKVLDENGKVIPPVQLPSSRALSTGKPVRNVVLGIHNPAIDMIRWVNVNVIPLFRNGEKKPYMVYSTFNDITDVTWAMKSLRESEEKYRTLINSIQELVFVFDAEDCYAQHYTADDSPLFCSPELFMGRHVSEVLPKEVSDIFLENMNFVRESNKSVTFDYPLEINDTKKWFSATMSLHDDAVSLVAVIRDITEKVRNDIEMQQQREELEIFASLLRHDLGNDVHAILNQIEWAELTQSAGTNDFNDSMESIKAIVFRMTSLLKSVGRSIEELDATLGAMLTKISSSSQKAHPGITVHVNIGDNETRDCDIAGLRLLPTVLDNLIRNSAEHSGRDVEVFVSAWIEGNRFCMEVKDNGPGISEEIRSRLFMKGVSTGEGGLGLYLTRRIMEAYNGSIILLDSGPDEGACFILELPFIEL